MNALDEALRSRLLTADDPRSNWMAGQLDRGDIESQVRHYAAARVAEPGNRLYLATLGMACLEPVQPRLPECDAVDRLADWATRDADNGLPVLLLANRARSHGDRESALAFLEQAATQPRFDDYWSAKAWAIWEVVRALPGPGDDGARPLLVAGYALPSGYAWADTARATCLPQGRADDAALREACGRLGQRMFDVGTTWQARMLGAAMLARTAATPEMQAVPGTAAPKWKHDSRRVAPRPTRSSRVSRQGMRRSEPGRCAHGNTGSSARRPWARSAPAWS